MSLPLQLGLADALPDLSVPTRPTAWPDPELVLLNEPLAAELGLDAAALSDNAARWFGGGALPEHVQPRAWAYAGHQFGHLTPRLGDGRAALLGELMRSDGTPVDLQLKGSGRTVFSRRGDGRAALDSVLREYIISEAMHALGVPTTRALAAVRTGETVQRYRTTPGGVLARVASSHLRVGTVEYLAIQEDHDTLRRLVGLALDRHGTDGLDRDADHPALVLLEAVGRRQVRLVARWMELGFVHGIMNTDNTSLSGETLDYGPCAFMEATDPDKVFSLVDEGGRYAWGRQPRIVLWNLARLAEALLPIVDPDPQVAIPRAQAVLERLIAHQETAWLDGMRRKLGLQGVTATDQALADDLVAQLTRARADWTDSFRSLAEDLRHGRPALAGTIDGSWNTRWRARLEGQDPVATAARMDAHNPLYIPRNHLVEAALDAAIGGDFAPTRTLIEVLSDPFRAQPGREAYARPAPDGGQGHWTHCNT